MKGTTDMDREIMTKKEIEQNRKELILNLQHNTKSLENWFVKNESDNLQEIIKESATGSTFRSFQGYPIPPSTVFRQWANKSLNKNTLVEFKKLNSQEKYDRWLEKFSDDLGSYWMQEMGPDNLILYGPERKLANLLMKRLLLWKEIACVRNQLVKYIHIPLDSMSLSIVRGCIYRKDYAKSIGEIDGSVTMKFVRNKEMYNAIQQIMRTIAKEAKVPTIYIDVLAWDFS